MPIAHHARLLPPVPPVSPRITLTSAVSSLSSPYSGVYREDEEILDVADVSRTAAVRALRFPLAPTLAVHWLAVEGIQPHIPQNPTSTAIKMRQERAAKRRRAQQVAAASASSSSSAPSAAAAGMVNAALPGAVVRPVVKHVLAKELQLYYEKITTIIMEGKSADLVHAAMTSLATDGGLHEIVPYMTQFVADEVTQNLRNVALLSRLMRAARGLLVNGNVHIEPYLHQLIPPILTCIVGQRLCEGPWEDHWGLRDYAAGLVALICQRFGKTYTELQGRITKSLSHAFLDPNRPLTTQYGAIVAIGALGPRVSTVLVKPNLEFYMSGLAPLLTSENPVERAEAGKCHGALLRCCGQIVHRAPTTDAYDELVEPFGESLLPFVSAAPTSQFLSV